MLKSKQLMVPGGNVFYSPELNWSLPNPEFTGFEEAVTAIIKVREANSRFNLPTDRASVSAELENFTEVRLRSIYGKGADQWLIGAPATASPNDNFLWRSKRQHLGAPSQVAVGNVEKAKAGIGLLTDFLGPSLKPVPNALAEKRASVCVTCPENQKGPILEHLAGESLKLLLQARSDLKLQTTHDAQLHECRICSCNLHLKPHVALDYILSKTSPEVMAAFPGFCWIARKDA